MRSLLFLFAIGSLIPQTFGQGSCTDVSTAECSDHEGCELCKMDLTWAKVNFCVSEEIAEKLPTREKKVEITAAVPVPLFYLTPCSNYFHNISYFFSDPLDLQRSLPAAKRNPRYSSLRMSALIWIRTIVRITTVVPGVYPLLSPLPAILLNRQNAFHQLCLHVMHPVLRNIKSVLRS